MAKFVFKLQPLLNVKEQMEENKKNELAAAVRKLEREKLALSELYDEEEKIREDFSRKSQKGTTVERLKESIVYISLLKEKIESQKEKVKFAGDHVDKVRRELIEAVKERKTLDKLKEKQHEDFLREAQKEENKRIDEIVSFKHNKR